MYGCSKDCLILILFRLPQISCFTLNLKCFSSDSDNCPPCEDWTPLQFLHPPKAGPVLLTLLFFPLSSFAWFYIFFSSGQVLMSALSWRSACTSVSEGVFLMYLWREMYSTSIYSSAILFSKTQIAIFQLCLVEHFCYFSKINFLRETFFEQFYKYLFIM